MILDKDKIIQIVHYLLRRYEGKLNYTKLIKILYLIDREALDRWETTVTGDSFYAMDSGPVLSGIYDLVMKRHFDHNLQQYWDIFFYTEGYDLVSMKNDSYTIDELSPREVSLIDEIDEKYHTWTYGRLIDLLHDREQFPEWEAPSGSSIPISKETVLIKLNRSQEEAELILQTEHSIDTENEILKARMY